jgi:hypothetical protein
MDEVLLGWGTDKSKFKLYADRRIIKKLQCGWGNRYTSPNVKGKRKIDLLTKRMGLYDHACKIWFGENCQDEQLKDQVAYCIFPYNWKESWSKDLDNFCEEHGFRWKKMNEYWNLWMPGLTVPIFLFKTKEKLAEN